MNMKEIHKFESQLGRYPIHLSMGNHYIKIDPSKVSELVSTIKQLHTENERCRKALEFYAQLDRNASVAEKALEQSHD